MQNKTRPFQLNHTTCSKVSPTCWSACRRKLCWCRWITVTEDQTLNKFSRIHQVSAFLDLKESQFVSLEREVNFLPMIRCQLIHAQGFNTGRSFCEGLVKSVKKKKYRVQIVLKSFSDFLQIILNRFHVSRKIQLLYFFSGHLRLTLLALYINVLMIIKKIPMICLSCRPVWCSLQSDSAFVHYWTCELCR